MSASSMLFESVWVSAAFLWRPVGGLRPYARAVQQSGTFTWSKSERREVRLLPSTPCCPTGRSRGRCAIKPRSAPELPR